MTVHFLQLSGRILTELVLHNAIDGCLRSQGASVGELLSWQEVRLVTLLLGSQFDIMAGSLSTVCLL